MTQNQFLHLETLRGMIASGNAWSIEPGYTDRGRKCDFHETVRRSSEATAVNMLPTNPRVVKRLLAFAEQARAELGDVDRPGKGQRPDGWVDQPSPRLKQN